MLNKELRHCCLSHKSGQTLVELLVAFLVITIGLTAAASMVFSNLKTQELSAERVVAINLAREGVEFAKSIRDSNWLAGNAFNEGLFDGTDYTAVPFWSGVQFAGFDFAPAAINDDSWTAMKLSASATSTNTLYYQGDSAVGTNTAYRRLVTLQPICSDDSIQTDGNSCPVSTFVIGIRVSSFVDWTTAGVTRDVSIVDEIYDWR